jgi:hypothetical protein
MAAGLKLEIRSRKLEEKVTTEVKIKNFRGRTLARMADARRLDASASQE